MADRIVQRFLEAASPHAATAHLEAMKMTATRFRLTTNLNLKLNLKLLQARWCNKVSLMKDLRLPGTAQHLKHM